MEVVFRPRTFREPWNHHVPFNSSTDCRNKKQEKTKKTKIVVKTYFL